MRKSLWIIPFLFAVIGAPAAHADTVDFTISGEDSGSIAITESSGSITAITGMFDGSTIASLLPTGDIGNNDNSFFSTPPYLDADGVSFSLTIADTAGFDDVNLYFAYDLDSYASYQSTSPGAYCETDCGTFVFDSMTPTPESGTAVLWLTGIVLTILMRKRLAQLVRLDTGTHHDLEAH